MALPLQEPPPLLLLPGMASPLTVAGISREEPRARRRLGSPVARRAGGLSSHERFLAEKLELRQRRPGPPPLLRRPLQFSPGLWGPLVRRRASGEGARLVLAQEATRGGRGKRARDGGGSRGCAALRVRGSRGRGRGPGSRGSFGFGVGAGGCPDGPGSLGSREHFLCPESPCAGRAQFWDLETLSAIPCSWGARDTL